MFFGELKYISLLPPICVILNFLKKKRAGYFSTKNMMLAGVETLLYQDIKPGVKFKGLIDLVFYHKNLDEWTIMDIKTSTSGWRDNQKKNPNLTAQVVLYKEFFSRQFNIPKEKINVEFFIVKRRVPAEADVISTTSGVNSKDSNLLKESFTLFLDCLTI